MRDFFENGSVGLNVFVDTIYPGLTVRYFWLTKAVNLYPPGINVVLNYIAIVFEYKIVA